jgi:hypothetical protein
MRGYPAGCMIGTGLFIHGGVGLSKVSIEPIVLNDWALFDVGLFCWINLRVRNETDNERNTSLVRKMHTMTALNDEVGGLQYM